MKCPNCNKHNAVIDSQYGVTFCLTCRKKETDTPKLGYEFTTESIKGQRREYMRDIEQPWRDGILSREYLEEYGTQGIEATEEDINNAKYTNKGQKGWWQRGKSKGGNTGRGDNAS